jgi:hypothetical protein
MSDTPERTLGIRTIGGFQRRLFLLSVGFLLLAMAGVLWTFVLATAYTSRETDIIVLTALRVRLLQVTLGLLIGLVLTTLGVLLTWLGVTGQVDVQVESAAVKARLLSAGPGAVMIVCGACLILACVLKDFAVRSNGYGLDLEPADGRLQRSEVVVQGGPPVIGPSPPAPRMPGNGFALPPIIGPAPQMSAEP